MFFAHYPSVASWFFSSSRMEPVVTVCSMSKGSQIVMWRQTHE
jgi:hypothetical protein